MPKKEAKKKNVVSSLLTFPLLAWFAWVFAYSVIRLLYDLTGPAQHQLNEAVNLFAFTETLGIFTYIMSGVSILIIAYILLSIGWKARAKYGLSWQKSAIYGAIAGVAGFGIWLAVALVFMIAEASLYLLYGAPGRMSYVIAYLGASILPAAIGLIFWALTGAAGSVLGNVLSEKKNEWA
ncbi:Uncharacterised protein [Candidatus Burarchaeum australiense]|nr:Uncharacterised protein [Candidatus Burarchaeum australiense]